MNKSEKSIFARFEQRKQLVKNEALADKHAELNQEQEIATESINALTDSDMPNIDTLNEDSDYSMFMSNKVSEVLKKKALRKLFLSPSINVLDSLNDYDEDYTTFKLLGDIIPHDLKQQIYLKNKEISEEALKEKSKEDKENLDSATNQIQPSNNEEKVTPTLSTKNKNKNEDSDHDYDNRGKQSSKTTSN